MEFIVKTEKCTHCGACVAICPVRILEMKEHPQVREGKGTDCMNCQHCLMVCPTASISVNGKSPEHAVACRDFPSAESMDRLFRCRRSCRRYKRENVSPELVARLMEAMAYTPTGVNVQKLHFTVIDDLDVMETFRRQVYDSIRVARDAGTVPEHAERFAKMLEIYDNKRYDHIFRGAHQMVIVACPPDIPCANADPFIALSYFELLAASLGLGTTWCGLAFWALQIFGQKIIPSLNFPPGYELQYCMLFGVPDVSFRRGAQRGPVSISRLTP